MAVQTNRILTNSQVSLHWPLRWRRCRLLSRPWARLQLWSSRVQQRAELARLGEQGLHDIGRTEADVQHELSKWFWQA